MYPNTELNENILILVCLAIVAAILWKSAKVFLVRINPKIPKHEAGYEILSYVTAMMYAVYPAGFIAITTMSVMWSVIVFAFASVVIWRAMFRN